MISTQSDSQAFPACVHTVGSHTSGHTTMLSLSILVPVESLRGFQCQQDTEMHSKPVHKSIISFSKYSMTIWRRGALSPFGITPITNVYLRLFRTSGASDMHVKVMSPKSFVFNRKPCFKISHWRCTCWNVTRSLSLSLGHSLIAVYTYVAKLRTLP